jgi:hypothetical protein
MQPITAVFVNREEVYLINVRVCCASKSHIVTCKVAISLRWSGQALQTVEAGQRTSFNTYATCHFFQVSLN